MESNKNISGWINPSCRFVGPMQQGILYLVSLCLLLSNPFYSAAICILKYTLFLLKKVNGYPFPTKVNPNSKAYHSGFLIWPELVFVAIFHHSSSCILYSDHVASPFIPQVLFVLYSIHVASHSSRSKKKATFTMASFTKAQVGVSVFSNALLVLPMIFIIIYLKSNNFCLSSLWKR